MPKYLGNATAFDAFPRASFAGIDMMVEKWSIKGELRAPMHEFPKVPAGKPEKLGRQPYRFTMRTQWHDVLQTSRFPFPDNYPTNLGRLIRIFERGDTDVLVVPNIGQVRAFCEDWNRELDSMVRSGETVDIVFVEDSLDLHAGDLHFAAAPAAGIAAQSDNLFAAAQARFRDELKVPLPKRKMVFGPGEIRDLLGPGGGDIFSAIRDAANVVLAVRDQQSNNAQLLGAKLDALTGLLQECDRTPEMLSTANADVFRQMMALWSAATQLKSDLLSKQSPIRQYQTVRDTTIEDVSIILYGDTSRSVEILQLNAIADAYNIPVGTTLNYYDPNASHK